MAFASKCAIVVVSVFALLLTHGLGRGVVDARRNQGSNQRKTSSSSNSGHSVTQPSYNPSNNGGGGGNSHADVAKLSYPNYNSQPNRPANNAPAAGWNVPQGPPPAYSASNPAGGSHTNMHEPPPAYHAPNYGAAPGSNVHQPISATHNQGQQYAGVPPGATYYPSGSHVPGGGYQPGGYQPGGMPAGGGYYPAGGYHPGGAAAPPPGATYFQAGSALPPGATYYAQPPQQSSSGLGFGTGLLAGGLGGALLGHALTPSGGSSSAAAPAAAPAAAAGQDRIIIINNGVPVNASDGTTVINAAGVAAAPVNATQTAADAPPAQLAPFAPANATMPMANGTDAAAPPPPPPGGIICVPTKINETDPADSSKMIEVEKIACYPAPPPPAAAPGAEPVPLAPMVNSQINSSPPPPPAMLAPDQAAVRSNTSGAAAAASLQTILPLLSTLFGGLLLRLMAGN